MHLREVAREENVKTVGKETFRGFPGGKKWSKAKVLSNSLWPHGLYSPGISPGQNTAVGSLSLLQGIFPTQGSNPSLPHCKRILYQLSHKGSPNGKKNHLPTQETQETWFPSLGWEDPLEEGIATHSRILAWRISWTEEPGGLPSIGSQRVRHKWSNLAPKYATFSKRKILRLEH